MGDFNEQSVLAEILGLVWRIARTILSKAAALFEIWNEDGYDCLNGYKRRHITKPGHHNRYINDLEVLS